MRVALTNDGDSFAPVVSPNGDQIAYLHRDGIDIDVRLMSLDIAPDGKITLLEDRAVTDDGSIDGESPPEWFIPRELRTNLDCGPRRERRVAGTERRADGRAPPPSDASAARCATAARLLSQTPVGCRQRRVRC